MAEWKTCTVGELCKTISETYKGDDEKVVLINTSDVLDGKILNHNAVENKNLKGQFKKTFRKNDILYSEIRPANKRFAFVDFEKTSNYIASTKLMVLRHNDNVLPEFLFALLKSNYVIAELQQLAETRSGTFPQITFLAELAPMEVKLPDKETQKQIVSILSSIEQRMNINEKINNNLEQQAMALFKSWFIDYEPYNRTVPNNWVEYKLSDFLPVITGKKNANVSSSIGTYPFFSCSQDITWTDEYSFEGNAILVAGNGDFNVKFYNGKFEAYQRTYVLIPHNPRFSAWLFYAVKYNLNKITAAARGSVIKFITKGNLEDFSFYAPLNLDDFDVIDQFIAINNIIASNREENACLSDLRDALLPKLMSGEFDVSNIDL